MGHHVKQQNNPIKIVDSVTNVLNSIGNKTNAIHYDGQGKLSNREAFKMYENSWASFKFVSKMATDMLKKPRQFEAGIEDEDVVELENIEKRLAAKEMKEKFLSFLSLTGDALIVAVTDCDDSTINLPLGDNEQLERFIVLDRRDYTPTNKMDDDLRSPRFGKALGYLVHAGTSRANGLEFHHSRCFEISLGLKSVKEYRKRGISDLQSALPIIKMFDIVIMTIGDLVQEAIVDVYAIEGLNEQIAAGREDKVLDYLSALKNFKSNANAVAIDKNDNWEQKTVSFSGLSEIISQVQHFLSAALDSSVTWFFGLSASGFSSGEEDNKQQYGKVWSLQESRLRPLQDFIDKFTFKEIGIDPNDVTYVYPSIEVTNTTANSVALASYATALVSLVVNSIITEEMALRELIQAGVIKSLTTDDVDAIKRLMRPPDDTDFNSETETEEDNKAA